MKGVRKVEKGWKGRIGRMLEGVKGRIREDKGGITRIALIIITLQVALCDFDIVFVGKGVEGVFAAGEDFTCVAVAFGVWVLLAGGLILVCG